MEGKVMAARRAAAAMVRSLGAATVRLEMPAPPVADDDGEQLGLGTPEFQTRMLSPVAIRSAKDAREVVVAAEVLETVLGVTGPGAVSGAAKAVYAVVVEDVRYRLSGVECVEAMGGACLYRMLLEPQGTEVV